MSKKKGTQGFNLSKTHDTSQSVYVNQLPLGLTNLFYDRNNNYITATCSQTSSSNITYTTNGKPVEYKAVQIWIVGQDPTNPLHSINGQSPFAGELIIKHTSTTGNETLYLCYPLKFTNTSTNGQVDNILNNYSDPKLAGTMALDISKDISAASKTTKVNPVYVQYDSTKISKANVLLYTNPLMISSQTIGGLKNTNPPIDMFPSQISNHNIIPLTVPGDWMECDYVPIDSEEVATLNMPLSSNAIKTGGAASSIQTILLFIIFFFSFYFSYLILPEAYSALAKRFIGNNVSSDAGKAKIYQMDLIVSAIFIFFSVMLIWYGATANVSNSGDYLLAGFSIGMIYTIGYTIIQSKKVNNNFPLG
jgi:hypothetical protein